MGGAPLLGAGQLLSTAALRELTKQLGASCLAEFLPENVVARTPELIAWWAPAAVRPMFFRDGSELAGISGKLFPHPALLFVVRNGVLQTRSLDVRGQHFRVGERARVGGLSDRGAEQDLAHGDLKLLA